MAWSYGRRLQKRPEPGRSRREEISTAERRAAQPRTGAPSHARRSAPNHLPNEPVPGATAASRPLSGRNRARQREQQAHDRKGWREGAAARNRPKGWIPQKDRGEGIRWDGVPGGNVGQASCLTVRAASCRPFLFGTGVRACLRMWVRLPVPPLRDS